MTHLQAWLFGAACALVALVGGFAAVLLGASRRQQAQAAGPTVRPMDGPERTVERAELADVQAELAAAEVGLQAALAQPTLDAQTEAVTHLLEAWTP